MGAGGGPLGEDEGCEELGISEAGLLVASAVEAADGSLVDAEEGEVEGGAEGGAEGTLEGYFVGEAELGVAAIGKLVGNWV